MCCVSGQRAEGRHLAAAAWGRVFRSSARPSQSTSEGNSCGPDRSPGLQLAGAPRVLQAALTLISSCGWLSTGCVCSTFQQLVRSELTLGDVCLF